MSDLDVIGGFVTEINVTSPTGARELQQQFGVDAAELLLQAIGARLESGRDPPHAVNPALAQRRPTLRGLAGLREGRAPVRERLMTMLFLAGIAHGIVILGLSFGAGGQAGGAAPGMEVLLVSNDLPEARRNDRATYLAQRTQIGSGNTRTLPTGSPEAHAAAGPQSLLGGLEQWAAATEVNGDERTVATQAPQPVIVWFGQAGQRAAATAAGAQARCRQCAAPRARRRPGIGAAR